MYNDDLNDDNIDAEISRLQNRIKLLQDLKITIANTSFYECGIRKLDHKICYFNFTLVGAEAVVEVKAPQSGETYRIGIDDFVRDYVPYSQKTRAILPKRNKR